MFKGNMDEDYRIEKLLDEIEESQSRQLEIISLKEHEISRLVDENESLQKIIFDKDKEIENLRKEVEKTKTLLLINERQHQRAYFEQQEEFKRIMELSNQLNEQDREIEKLELKNKEQKEKFIELEK